MNEYMRILEGWELGAWCLVLAERGQNITGEVNPQVGGGENED